MPRQENAQLLRHQGVAFLQRNAIQQAATNLRASLDLQSDDEVYSLLQDAAFNGVTSIPTRKWLMGQTIGVASFAIPFLIVFLYIAWLGSSPATTESNTSPGQNLTTSNSTPVPAATAPAFQVTCLHGSNTIAASTLRAACVKTRDYLGKQQAGASDQSDRDDFIVLGAIAEYAEAAAAQRLGYQHESDSEAAEALAVLDNMRQNASDPEAKKYAARYYDCYKRDQCSKQ
jgi:hypothetical protein